EQTLSVLRQLESSLASMGLRLGDVAKMTVFLVGDPVLGGRMDFDGFMAAYRQYFGTEEQPNLPARSAVQVTGLANEGMLVEIEVVLARAATGAREAVAAPGAPATGLHSADADFAYCTVCHGSEGLGNAAVGAPNIAVLEPWYLERQLEAYRDGIRGAEDDYAQEMQVVAARFDDAQIDAIVDYIASFSPKPRVTVSEPAQGDIERGRELYTACAGCHGTAAQGNEAAGGPTLAGQSDWYLVRQLEAYIDGRRPSSPADPRGTQMAAAARMLETRDAVRDVVAHIGTLAAPSARTALQRD
ncbi:MAG: c-type cytochrome, partial [Gammaproteobacteria bacterium]|nr:c-type cytochrome [Gammaproteobacteria bacterium]